ncbi:atlastin-2 [Hyalella azteca]|uniref:Atlastin-2 n=1 Tax=Hyalella azteca TaxID=294128 RepID=A0A8B7PHD4_HYAAZ|nr:atlastin-2 [Hyalella azteca]
MSGHPVPIVVQTNDSLKFELDEDALKSILLNSAVGDKPVCVVAVAGAFRQGKSFLMNLLVKYCANKGSANWLGNPSQPLEGFVWRGGIDGETTGINIWSEPFVFTKPTGEKVAVILMDTQGTFDFKTSMQDSTFIFALTLLTSSVTVYNLMNNIREDDLMNLQTFCTFGTLAQNSINQNSCAFQKLLFLVRDWNFPRQYPYGHQGGKTVLKRILTVNEDQEPAHQDIREGLGKSFEELECYLMPHIGMRAIRDEDFDGQLNQLDEEFVEHMKLLVPRLLAPENLVEKLSAAQSGQPATGEELVRLFRTYMAVFRERRAVLPTTLVQIMVRVKSDETCKMAFELYKRTMDSKIESRGRSLEDSFLNSYHSESKRVAITAYNTANQYARNNASFATAAEVREILVMNIDEHFRTYVQKNDEMKLDEVGSRSRLYILGGLAVAGATALRAGVLTASGVSLGPVVATAVGVGSVALKAVPWAAKSIYARFLQRGR